MRARVFALAEAVYDVANPAINGRGLVGWLLSPWAFGLAFVSGAVADWLDPIPPK
jgi:hypothetical protein